MAKHYDPDNSVSEEVVTEDGMHTYWRFATPMPMFIGGGFFTRATYGCVCGEKFLSKSEYTLHYRKAYEEEQHVATHGLLMDAGADAVSS